MRRQQKGILSWRRWHNVGELPMYGEFGGYPFIHLQHKIIISWFHRLTFILKPTISALTRCAGPTNVRFHLSHCSPCLHLHPHLLTGLPINQKWDCWHCPPAPAQEQCCVSSPLLSPPPRVGPRCWCHLCPSWSCSCSLFCCLAPFLDLGLLGCCHLSLVDQWPLCLKYTTNALVRAKWNLQSQQWEEFHYQPLGGVLMPDFSAHLQLPLSSNTYNQIPDNSF